MFVAGTVTLVGQMGTKDITYYLNNANEKLKLILRPLKCSGTKLLAVMSAAVTVIMSLF